MIMPIKGSVNVTISIEDVNKINELIRKDTARPVKVHHYTSKGLEGQTADCCPVCGTVVGEICDYCGKCGQKIDHSNTEL